MVVHMDAAPFLIDATKETLLAKSLHELVAIPRPQYLWMM
jgi:hypothetical protein